MASAAEEARKATAAYAKFQAAADLAETSSKLIEQAAQQMRMQALETQGKLNTVIYNIEQSGRLLDRAIQSAEARQNFWYFLLWCMIAGLSGAYLPGALQWFVSLFR